MKENKRGRPTSNPKPNAICIRLDSTCEQILADYCQKNEVSRAEAVRRAILLLGEK